MDETAKQFEEAEAAKVLVEYDHILLEPDDLHNSHRHKCRSGYRPADSDTTWHDWPQYYRQNTNIREKYHE